VQLRTRHRLAISLGALGALGVPLTLSGTMVGTFAGCGGDEDPSTPGGPNQSASTSTDEQLVSCTPIDAGATAPTCPQPQPSFARDIAPLLDRDCNDCHTPGSTLWPLVGYEDVRDWANLILTDLDGCRMPPADGGTAPLSTHDRALILGWIGCGANNN